MRGYELDEVVLEASRSWMGLKEIEDTKKLVKLLCSGARDQKAIEPIDERPLIVFGCIP